jgi:hypothetical protein
MKVSQEAVQLHAASLVTCISHLTLILLMWRIWRAPNNASKWQMGFNLAFEGLKPSGDYISLYQLM